MVNYARIQHHIDRGLGKAGQKLGPPFSAYRIESGSAGDWPGGWTTIATGYPIFRRRVTETKIESNLKAGNTLYYDIIGNMEPFLLGDVFLQTDPTYQPGVSYGPGATSIPGTIQINALFLAWHPAVRKGLGMRLDYRARIYRPTVAPTVMGDGSLYWKEQRYNDQPLVLSGGTYSWGTSGDLASLVPVGLGATERPMHGKGFPPGSPGIAPTSRYYICIPPIPGYLPIEGDAIITEDDARYVVANPYQQQAGVSGIQVACERTIPQAR